MPDRLDRSRHGRGRRKLDRPASAASRSTARPALALAYILLPLFFVTWLAFFRQEIPSFPPEGYSLRWFLAIAGNDQLRQRLPAQPAGRRGCDRIGLAPRRARGLCLARFRFGGPRGTEQLLLLPLVVPGIVLGTALYVFHVETEIATGLPILGSLAGLVAGHVLIVIPWTVRLVDREPRRLRPHRSRRPRRASAPIRFTTFRRVTLPAIRPGIVAAALFGFVTSFGNLEMSLFLVGPGRTTLPIAILQYLEWKIDPTIAAVSVLQILLIGSGDAGDRPLRQAQPGGVRRMARLGIDRHLRKRYGDFHARPTTSRSTSPTASSSCCSAPPAAARPRPCAWSPASSSRPPAASASASATSPHCRPGSATPGSCSRATRCSRI